MDTIYSLIRKDLQSYLKLHKNPNILVAILAFFHNPGMFFSLIYRFENGLINSDKTIIKLFGWIFLPVYFVVTYYVLDFQIDANATLGSGLYLHNRGIIIASGVKAGKNLVVLGPVTIGDEVDYDQLGSSPKSPNIGDNVIICTGAKVIGGVNVGNDVVVGANAVVIRNIPDNNLAVGVPARCIKKRIPSED